MINKCNINVTTFDITERTGKRHSLELTRKRAAKKSSFDDLLQLAEKQLRTEDDRYDILGKSIASKMRGIQCSDQDLYAEHMIDEVLFQARLRILQSSTSLVNFKCFKEMLS